MNAVVLLELLTDERLKGCQLYAFKEYKNANGTASLELMQMVLSFLKLPSAACPGKVPIAIMLYIDATFIKRGISIRPICRKFLSLNGM